MIKYTTTPFRMIDRAPARFAQIIVALSGIVFALTAALLLFMPRWFFENIGNFPPFNRHYMGDLGAFLLPLGLGLLVAARDPARYRLLIAVAAVGSALHVANHILDGVALSFTLEHWFTDTVPLAISTLLLIVVLRTTR